MQAVRHQPHHRGIHRMYQQTHNCNTATMFDCLKWSTGEDFMKRRPKLWHAQTCLAAEYVSLLTPEHPWTPKKGPQILPIDPPTRGRGGALPIPIHANFPNTHRPHAPGGWAEHSAHCWSGSLLENPAKRDAFPRSISRVLPCSPKMREGGVRRLVGGSCQGEESAAVHQAFVRTNGQTVSAIILGRATGGCGAVERRHHAVLPSNFRHPKQ